MAECAMPFIPSTSNTSMVRSLGCHAKLIESRNLVADCQNSSVLGFQFNHLIREHGSVTGVSQTGYGDQIKWSVGTMQNVADHTRASFAAKSKGQGNSSAANCRGLADTRNIMWGCTHVRRKIAFIVYNTSTTARVQNPVIRCQAFNEARITSEKGEVVIFLCVACHMSTRFSLELLIALLHLVLMLVSNTISRTLLLSFLVFLVITGKVPSQT